LTESDKNFTCREVQWCYWSWRIYYLWWLCLDNRSLCATVSCTRSPSCISSGLVFLLALTL